MHSEAGTAYAVAQCHRKSALAVPKPLYYENDTLAISFIFSSQKIDFTLRNGKRASVGTLYLFFSGGFALPAAFELLVAETVCHV